jgi:hypothetical protein
VNYSATFVSPIELSFDNYTVDVPPSASYGWRAFTSYDRESGDYNWNYREKAQTGPEYNADSDPFPQVGSFREPDLDENWNKV